MSTSTPPDAARSGHAHARGSGSQGKGKKLLINSLSYQNKQEKLQKKKSSTTPDSTNLQKNYSHSNSNPSLYPTPTHTHRLKATNPLKKRQLLKFSVSSPLSIPFNPITSSDTKEVLNLLTQHCTEIRRRVKEENIGIREKYRKEKQAESGQADGQGEEQGEQHSQSESHPQQHHQRGNPHDVDNDRKIDHDRRNQTITIDLPDNGTSSKDMTITLPSSSSTATTSTSTSTSASGQMGVTSVDGVVSLTKTNTGKRSRKSGKEERRKRKKQSRIEEREAIKQLYYSLKKYGIIIGLNAVTHIIFSKPPYQFQSHNPINHSTTTNYEHLPSTPSPSSPSSSIILVAYDLPFSNTLIQHIPILSCMHSIPLILLSCTSQQLGECVGVEKCIAVAIGVDVAADGHDDDLDDMKRNVNANLTRDLIDSLRAHVHIPDIEWLRSSPIKASNSNTDTNVNAQCES